MNNGWIIVGMVIVTFIPRYLPLAMANRVHLSPTLIKALSYVPIAVLTVIISQTVFYQHGQLNTQWNNPYLLGALASAICAFMQPRLLISIVVGMLVYGVARFYF
ncbi:AzlD domain-containing protein [Neptunicella marina]|uniref:AzlD domain-containing protein n=1 Tax=Neptunicella marina TaxID=2125989 RepID=A0A8J6M355_9ALTE|nr:AzlD domain-containing protein [Neptunicella marina]MBC3767153.1 AzlD domain-containing protein [Neptunicella marina]